ncbi:MAG: hypothetical protein ABIJ09_10120 [Pseudomonadota bacterium]
MKLWTPAVVVVLLLLGVVACDALTGAGQRPAGTRLIQLDLPAELAASLGNQVTGLQLAAVVVPREQFAFHTSSTIDPSVQLHLQAYLPVGESPVLAVQTPGAGGAGSPGRLVARLTFDDGLGGLSSRLPVNVADLDLGTPGYPGSARLVLDDAHNPFALNDRDGDGAPDLTDGDDDGDGSPDAEDGDADGDGVDDALQGWEALSDDDLDGTPDLFE